MDTVACELCEEASGRLTINRTLMLSEDSPQQGNAVTEAQVAAALSMDG